MSKVVEPTWDALYVVLDNNKSDGPCLVVARKTKPIGARISTTTIINTFYGDDALRLYDKLTNIKEQKMTNFEHMSEEEKKLAIAYGLHTTKNGEIKACHTFDCRECKDCECDRYLCKSERVEWLNSEQGAPKTENEKFCETLKVGEVIAVSDDEAMSDCLYRAFCRYEAERDIIITKSKLTMDLREWRYGRKLTAEEKGE